jgi:hypothetical protein
VASQWLDVSLLLGVERAAQLGRAVGLAPEHERLEHAFCRRFAGELERHCIAASAVLHRPEDERGREPLGVSGLEGAILWIALLLIFEVEDDRHAEGGAGELSHNVHRGVPRSGRVGDAPQLIRLRPE